MMNESANNLSKEQQFYIKKTRHHKHLVLFFQIFIFVFFIILWEISSHNGIINAFIFSSPSQMLLACQELFLTGDLLKHIGITLAETFGSFFLVASISLLVAILLWWNTTLSEIFEPYFVILNSLPKSAMAPIFIVWLGNNMKTIIVTAKRNITTCERVSKITEVSKIGDIKKGIDKNKVLNLLNIERYSQDRCKDCWAYQHCTICIACADDTKNISNKEIEKHCWKVRGGFEEAMKNYCTLKELGYKFEEYE